MTGSKTGVVKTILTAVALLATAGPLVAQDALPPAEQLIDRYIEAIGGRDLLLSHTSSRSTGTFSMPAAGITGQLVVQTAAPDRIITQIDIPGLGVIRSGFDGEVGWSMDPNLGPRLLDGMELASIRESANYRAALRDPSLFSVRETVEEIELNGQACYKVRLVWNSGRETHDCYSVETGLMVGTMSTQESPMGAIETISLLEDYREYHGVLSPTRVRQQAFGQEQLMTIETIEYDVLDEDAFELPAAIRTLIAAAEATPRS